jgi:hypothetical protein
MVFERGMGESVKTGRRSKDLSWQGGGVRAAAFRIRERGRLESRDGNLER